VHGNVAAVAAAGDQSTRAGDSAPHTRAAPFQIVDVFTDVPLAGNQLGVFTAASSIAPALMQRLASELGFSETVFVLPPQQRGDARLRIFTPALELPFAGHPVLGAAFVIAEELGSDALALETELATIPVALAREHGRVAFGTMRQRVPVSEPYERAPELLRALGVKRSGLPVEAYDNGPLHVYVELETPEEGAALSPDMRALAEIDACANCFARTASGFKTRMFAASAGVAEDPATGSAAGPLAVHLARHGRISFGERIEIRQGEEVGRPSVLYASAHGSAESTERVEVGGGAVIVARGEFELPDA
jgi:trans-2,3-dihydro-3-hydroxyanthranilate isomerase